MHFGRTNVHLNLDANSTEVNFFPILSIIRVSFSLTTFLVAFEFENSLHSSTCFSVSCNVDLSLSNQKAPSTLRTWDYGSEKVNSNYIENVNFTN